MSSILILSSMIKHLLRFLIGTAILVLLLLGLFLAAELVVIVGTMVGTFTIGKWIMISLAVLSVIVGAYTVGREFVK